ncbi:MAG: thiol-disulfide oxidoreductase DCC family protein [Bacteroidota bacterium]
MNNQKPLILFDGYCNLCSASVQFILKYEQSPVFYFSSLQSGFVKKYYSDLYNENADPDTVILIENDEIYYRSDAALRISRRLKLPLNYLYYLRFIPRFIRDGIYGLISRYRYWFFGKKNNCFIPDSKYSGRFLN